MRFIPAGAGNMSHILGGSFPLSGSSPRVRGTLVAAAPEMYELRFIPAGAGNIYIYYGLWGYCPVHPRGCGEHCTVTPDKEIGTGSSPRVRGTSAHHAVKYQPIRFIPAGAGNISAVDSRYWFTPVHPRGCGEHSSNLWSHCETTGSSPRVRGTYLLYLFKNIQFSKSLQFYQH